MPWSDWKPGYVYNSAARGVQSANMVYHIDRWVTSAGPNAVTDRTAAVQTALDHIKAGSGTDVSAVSLTYADVHNILLTVVEPPSFNGHAFSSADGQGYSYNQTGGALIDFGYVGATFTIRDFPMLPSDPSREAPPGLRGALPPPGTPYNNYGLNGLLDFRNRSSTLKHWNEFGHGVLNLDSIGASLQGDYATPTIDLLVWHGPTQYDPNNFFVHGVSLADQIIQTNQSVEVELLVRISVDNNDDSHKYLAQYPIDISSITSDTFTMYMYPNASNAAVFVPRGEAYTIAGDFGSVFATATLVSPPWRYWIPEPIGAQFSAIPRGTGSGREQPQSTTFWR